MVIKTERLEIKEIQDGDREALIDLLTNNIINQTYLLPDYKDRSEAIPLANKITKASQMPDRFTKGIYFQGNMIGFVNDVVNENQMMEVGYVIHPNHHRKGFASEMLKAVVDYLFSIGYKIIEAGAFETNRASVQVMKNSGMTKIKKEEDLEYRGKTHHCVYYAIENKGGNDVGCECCN